MSSTEITFDTLPKAVAYLIEEISTLKAIVENQQSAAPMNTEKEPNRTV